MHPCWQLLERHTSELNARAVLWLDPPEPHQLMKADDRALCLSQSSASQSPAPTLLPGHAITEPITLIVLFLPKAKRRLDWWLRQIESLALPVPVWIVGENDAGIKSIVKRLAPHISASKIDSARHCGLLECRLETPLPQQDAWHYYEVDGLRVGALPGVFSQEKLDVGTRLLLASLPTVNGHVFEFGCGAGVICLWLLKHSPSCQIVATDIDWLAVDSTRHNVQQSGVTERCEVIWSDGMSQVPAQRFDMLITNPPFHTGIRTHYEPSERFFLEADHWLKPGGELWWVANDFLNYQALLGRSFQSVSEVDRGQGFRVYRAIKR
ncbi:MAG: methyltransferase [Saccharospirillum sp.]